MLVDFHTHTTASDGALSPADLFARAEQIGVSQLAITDHDTLAGVRALSDVGDSAVTLVAGTELSCVWSGTNVHIVGLAVDGAAPRLDAILSTLQRARIERAQKIAERLERESMPGALQGATAVAGDSQIGRPHFAAWMVNAGHASSMSEAFDRWLGRGKLGDVKAFWPPLEDVVAALAESGGVAVLAHPLKYRFTRMKLRALVAAFSEAGGRGIEVLSGRQTSDETAQLKRLASDTDLAMSLGSDFHRDWPHGPDIGVDTRVVPEGAGVWELFP